VLDAEQRLGQLFADNQHTLRLAAGALRELLELRLHHANGRYRYRFLPGRAHRHHPPEAIRRITYVIEYSNGSGLEAQRQLRLDVNPLR